MTMTDLIRELEAVMGLLATKAMLSRAGEGAAADFYLIQYEQASSEFLRTHHAALADMAKRLEAAEMDAAYGRALIDAMNAEYQAAKESRKGGKQESWITTYCLLRRIKVAANHLCDAATQEGEG
jgi:hypothetical protein